MPLDIGAAPQPVPALPALERVAADFAPSPHPIVIACDPGLRLPPSEVDALAAAAREGVDNALRYAFPAGREGRVWVSLGEDRGRIRLVVRDNGVGAPDLAHDGTGGLGRADALAAELGGFARIASAPFGGAELTVVYRRA